MSSSDISIPALLSVQQIGSESMQEIIYWATWGLSLGVTTANGYIQLLAKTYGLFYWQKVVVDIKNGTRSWEYDKFEENMKVINPNFKLSELEAFYNSIRLNRL